VSSVTKKLKLGYRDQARKFDVRACRWLGRLTTIAPRLADQKLGIHHGGLPGRSGIA
jgi:hypothetical protein